MRREKTGDNMNHFRHSCFLWLFVANSYKDIWKPSITDKLACERDFDNCFDKFAVKVVNNGKQWAIYHTRY